MNQQMYPVQRRIDMSHSMVINPKLNDLGQMIFALLLIEVVKPNINKLSIDTS